MKMGEHEKFTPSGLLAESLRSLLADEGIQVNPKFVQEKRQSWTVEMVEEVFENVWPVIHRLPSEKLAVIVSKPEVVTDYAETVAAKVAPPAYHIDQLEDVFQWILWLRPHQRKVIWHATSYTDYLRKPWGKIAGKAGVVVPVTGNRRRDAQSVRRRAKKLYHQGIATICVNCNEKQYPHRGIKSSCD